VIVVSDPGFLPTTRQMALALTDVLDAYVTPIVAGRRTIPAELALRTHTLRTIPELTRIALQRAHLDRWNFRLLWRRNVEFDRRVAGLLDPEATLVGQYGAALAGFRRVAGAGRAILDYPIARFEFARDLLEEEARRRPELGETLVSEHALFPGAPELARIAAELDLADLVVVGSSFAARSFAGVVEPERIAVVPYGVDTERFLPHARTDSSGPLRVLFAGQLSQRKGIAYALEAMPLLDPARFALTVVGPVIGSGRGLARHAGSFRHLAPVAPALMPEIFRRADVLVLPSLVEGSASVVVEAMACGLPVVVTANTGADAVRPGVDGFVVPIRSPEAIAEALERLADPELRARMGAAARARSLEYDWSVFRRAFRDVVEQNCSAPVEAVA
jgi:glycosyltransferase involved in cell wall biosynthesis